MKDPEHRHGLNVFFTRLLFCYFAEDTGIFEENQFTNAVGSHTLDDGSDTADFIRDLFGVLDDSDLAKKLGHLASCPNISGRLFWADALLTVPRVLAEGPRFAHRVGQADLVGHQPGHLRFYVLGSGHASCALKFGAAFHFGAQHPQDS